jgi:hypothetical protein
MAKQFAAFESDHMAFIAASPIFFVGSAAPEGQVNVSPKGMDSLRVVGPNRVLWRNLTGSGNETAGHLRMANRMTLMWCSFTTRPLILRAFGAARVVHKGEADWEYLNAWFPPDVGARQVFDMDVKLVQTSCGYAVPFMDYRGERDTLHVWAEKKAESGIADYWSEKNRTTIDGFPTGIPI